MGSGKTTVGQQLSQKLGLPVIDLDQQIEAQAQCTVAEFFKTKGELTFRKLEHQILQQLLARPEKFILTLGGGTPCYFDNHLLLQQPFIISFFLKTSVATLVQRIQHARETRPLLAHIDDAQLEEFVAKHLFDRNAFYLQANHIISTDLKNAEEVADDIRMLLQNRISVV